VANTGWTWSEAGTLTIPRLNALMRQWNQCPPVHRMVAAYVGWKAPAEERGASIRHPSLPGPEDDAAPSGRFVIPGLPTVQPSQALLEATSPGEAIKALERMFFGEIKHVEQL
jgi:hypothetical protein